MSNLLAAARSLTQDQAVLPVLGQAAEVLLENEPFFLKLMDRITFQFDQEARARILAPVRVEGYAGDAVRLRDDVRARIEVAERELAAALA